MTIEEFAELVIRSLGFNNNEKIEERDVLGATDLVRAQLMDDMLAHGGSLTGEYVRTFEAELLWDQEKRMHYTERPCRILALSKNQAYRQIGRGDIEESWAIMTPGQVAVYSKLEAGQAGGRTLVIPMGDRDYYRYLPQPEPKKIKMVLVPSCLWMYEFRDDSEIIGTAGLTSQVKDMVIEKLKLRQQVPIMNYEQRPTP